MNLRYVLTAHGAVGGGGDSIPPSNVRMAGTEIGTDRNNILIKWLAPIDSEYKGVRFVRKVGSYPEHKTDGDIAYDGLGTPTGAIASYEGYKPEVMSFVDAGLAYDTAYYYRAFPYDDAGNFNDLVAYQRASRLTLPKATIYGFRIDHSNSNPAIAVTYIEDSAGFTPATIRIDGTDFNARSWADKFPFNKIRPVEFSAGRAIAEVNKNDFNLRTTGAAVEPNNDVMIEIPPVYYKVTNVGGTATEYRFSDVQVDSTYRAYAHERGAENVKGNLYVGAYEGCTNGGSKLHSQTGKSPIVNETIGTLRTYAQNCGSGYGLCTVHTYMLLKILFVAMFKSLDSQTALGKGVISASSAYPTGGVPAKGMYFGNTASSTYVKFMGIENIWGNIAEFMDGCYIVPLSNTIRFGNQTGTVVDATNYAYTLDAARPEAGYMRKAFASEMGFFPSINTGSSSTYYCDHVNLPSQIPVHGGDYGYSTNAGIFALSTSGISSSSDRIGARLMYLAS